MASLPAIHTALRASSSPDAASLCALIQNNKVAAYRSGVRQRFGPSENDRPQLGNKFALFSSNRIPAVQDLKETFLRAFEETPDQFGDRDTYFAPVTATEETSSLFDEDKLSQITNNLRSLDTVLGTANHVIAFQSEVVDNMRIEKSLEPDDLLHTSMTRCSIVPSNTLIHLQHTNEGINTMTLFSGSVIWVIWPPTDHNLRTLQATYEDYAQGFDMATLDVTQNFQDGLMLLQTKGEGLRIPPFCPIISFTTKTSVIASSSDVTADGFVSMLRKAPLIKANYKIEPDGELKQTEFNASMLKWLNWMLNGKIDEDTKAHETSYKLTMTDRGPLHTILNTWDDVKDGLAAMMSAKEQETMKDIWSVFLTGSKGRECKLCGKRVPKKPSLMREHFADEHWPKAKVAERIDSMEVISHDGEDLMERVEATGNGEV